MRSKRAAFEQVGAPPTRASNLRGLMAFALAENMITSDPTDGIKPIRAAKSMGHITWLEPQEHGPHQVA
jgi:hypothetical protein